MIAALVAALLALPAPRIDYSLPEPVIFEVAQAAVVENPPFTIQEQIDEAALAAGISPALAERIASCESASLQFRDNGSLLRGRDGHDVGIFQIRETLHRRDAESLGLDINSIEGNIAYAMILYKRNGTKDWEASKSCWSRVITTTNSATSSHN